MRTIAQVLAAWGFLLSGASVVRGLEPPQEAVPPNASVDPLSHSTSSDEAALDVVSLARELESLIVPLPPARRIHTHVYRNGKVTSRVEAVEGALPRAVQAGVPEDILIYSSTNADRMLRLNGTNWRYGEDLWTNTLGNAKLSRYVVRVNGGVPYGVGEFSCKTSIWVGCPSTNSGGIKIPGTDATFTGLADDSAEFHDLTVDLSADPVLIPPAIWVQLECDSATAGWAFGRDPELAYSQYGFFHPAVGCASLLGPAFPGALYAQAYAISDPDQPLDLYYRAYIAEGGNLAALSGGAGQLLADDFLTGYDGTGVSCILGGYEVGVRGSAPSQFNIDLRIPFSDSPLHGTEFVYQYQGTGRIEIARHIVPEDIEISVDETMWVTWRASTSSAGVVNVRYPDFGSSADEFYWFSVSGSWVPGFSNPRAAVHVIPFCRGPEPDGACCYHGGVCLDEMPGTSCQSGRWDVDLVCADDAFDPPCGTHACCLPDNTCGDLTREACDEQDGFWQSGQFCASVESSCRHYACWTSSESCNVSHSAPACTKWCCDQVCDLTPECCSGPWDASCVRTASQVCGCIQAPNNDCAPTNAYDTGSAYWITTNSELAIDTCALGTISEDPGFCCAPDPAAYFYGSAWFRFVASDSSARIHTCATISGDAGDSMLHVFSAGNPTDLASACDSLASLACNDDAPICGTGSIMSDLCVTNLTLGDTYYIMLASKTPQDRGIYKLRVESPCPADQLMGPCVEGLPRWDMPASGTVVDARQPFDPEAPDEPFGVVAVTVQAPPHAEDAACWTLCDTLGNPQGNDVLTVENHGNGSLTLHLAHPLTPGAETKITYNNSSGCASAAGSFSYLPGDVNGHNGAIASEDGALFGLWCLSDPPGLGLERCDIDRTGIIAAADYIRLIDLFNGAGSFDAWNGRIVSTAPCE